MHPCPKCPYKDGFHPYLLNSFFRSMRYSPTFSGGTAESSHPSSVVGSPGTHAVAPRPALRTSHSLVSCTGSSKRVMVGGFFLFFNSSINCFALLSESSF